MVFDIKDVNANNSCIANNVENTEPLSKRWINDSGATNHICSDINNFIDLNASESGTENMVNGMPTSERKRDNIFKM